MEQQPGTCSDVLTDVVALNQEASSSESTSRIRTRLAVGLPLRKRDRYEPSFATTSSTGQESHHSSAATSTTMTHSKSRLWRQPWNEHTISLFFEALKLCGKDFDTIKKYIAHKSKLDGKNYDQVRNFYYNTWIKLSSRLNFNDVNAPREAKELFSLISYGELMRKAESLKMTSKHFNRILSEIVRNGSTMVRIKLKGKKQQSGKSKFITIRIKVPQCPALQKFYPNSLCNRSVAETIKQHDELPKLVLLELVPRTNRDRSYVLKCEQNPQIKFKLPLQQKFKDILQWLQNKWCPPYVKRLKTDFDQDISGKLPVITVYPSEDVTLMTVKIAPKSLPTAAGAIGLVHCFERVDQNASFESEQLSAEEANKIGDSDVFNLTTCSDNQSTADFTKPSVLTNLSKETSGNFTLQPDDLENGLCSTNADFSLGHLCLMCNCASTIRFKYSIESRLGEDEATPAWMCFLNLIKHDFADILEKKVRCNDNDTVVDAINTKSTIVASRPTQKRPTAIAAIMPPVTQAPIVASENRAFLLQYKQIIQDANNRSWKVPISRRQKIPTTIDVTKSKGTVTLSSLSNRPAVPKQHMFTRLIGPGPVLTPAGVTDDLLPPPTPGAAQRHVVQEPATPPTPASAILGDDQQRPVVTPVICFGDMSDAEPQPGPSNAELHVDTSLPMSSPVLADFSFSSNSSFFGLLSCTPTKKDPEKPSQQPRCIRNVMDFSLDSVKSFGASNLNASNDTALQRDVKKSFELLMHQDSVEYCKNFADLVGNLETPKKLDFSSHPS